VGYNETLLKGIAMFFKDKHIQVKVAKDIPSTPKEPTLMDRLNGMTPEELEKLQKKIMKQALINIGALIVVKASVPIILAIIAKKLEASAKH